MAKKRKRTVEDAYDRRFRNDPGAESRDLTDDEATLFAAARKATEDLHPHVRALGGHRQGGCCRARAC